jgi:CheY-like chemotaxis protein
MVILQEQQEHDLQILVVEDDDDTAEVVCTLLEDAGYRAIAVDR